MELPNGTAVQFAKPFAVYRELLQVVRKEKQRKCCSSAVGQGWMRTGREAHLGPILIDIGAPVFRFMDLGNVVEQAGRAASLLALLANLQMLDDFARTELLQIVLEFACPTTGPLQNLRQRAGNVMANHGRFPVEVGCIPIRQ